MKTTPASDYALHALIYMVLHISQLPLSRTVIARAENIPSSYLAKILQKLSRHNIVKASSSPQGGYEFARPPKEISLLDIFEAIEGKQLFYECFLQHGPCDGCKGSCDLYIHWQKASQEMRKFLAQTFLDDIAWTHSESCRKHTGTLPAANSAAGPQS